MLHSVALYAYGMEKKENLSCIKCTRLLPRILLEFFGTQARDCSPKRSSYQYIHIPDAHLIRNYLILKVTDDEKQTIEEMSRREELHPNAYLWENGEWYEFPYGRDNPQIGHGDYRLAAATHSFYPRFSGDTVSGLIPSQSGVLGACTAPIPAHGLIKIERSARPGKIPWWWISGNTKPVHEIIAGAGAHWSGKRQAWYYIGENLPATIQSLADAGDKALHSGVAQPQASPSEALVYLDPDTPIDIDLLKRTGAKREIETGRWYYDKAAVAASFEAIVADDPVEQTQPEAAPLSKVQQPIVLSAPASDPPAAKTTKPPKEEVPPIRIIKPDVLTTGKSLDTVQQAVLHAKTLAIPKTIPVTSTFPKKMTAIGQAYVGELTGNISGNVHCYGYAVHNGIAVYINMGGPRTAVEAIRAKLGRGEVVNLTPWDGPAEELTAGEGLSGQYEAFIVNMPEAKFTSAILVHKMLTVPLYGGKSTTFILRTSDDQAVAKLKHHVTRLVKIPVFDEWSNYLWQAGQAALLVQRPRSGGDIDLVAVDLDVDAWTRLITGGLAQQVISLPLSQ